ncbi:MAG: S-layer homology domain-containing protein [Lawsonibacter sp.]|nr:S-layer homology domain-containing protein [Lawsonibacter sp.]
MMKKYIPAVLLAVCLSLMVPAFAASAPASTSEAAQVVNALGIMVGDSSGNMNLGQKVTRAEFITMAVKATPGGDQIGQAATSPYPDVPWKHWASGYVEAGVADGLISGYTDGSFRPSNPISLAEGATIALGLLGYSASDFSGAYPAGQLAMYHSLKLDRGVSVSAASVPLTRQDAMYLFYNLMTAKTKAGEVYLKSLGHSLNAAGEIDLVSLVNDAMEGPVVAQGSWQSSIPFSVSEAVVYRNGAASSTNAIQTQDVVYWNAAMKTLWVYNDRVTGSIQALEPSSSAPTSVTVAGRTCGIETSAAAYALSDLGQYSLGDTVTLLLGRDGSVAAVADGTASASERLGVVTAIENAAYSDGKGGTYTARTVTLLATDGRTYRYENKAGMKEGSLVRVVDSDQTGGVTLRSVSSASFTGKVNAAGTQAGSYSFAQDVEILDVSDAYGVRIYPSRLAGVNLSSNMVKYYSLNSSGEIDRMILNDATGDVYQYGILTELSSEDAGDFPAYYSYAFDLGGVAGTISSSATRYPVSEGPIRVKGTTQAPEKLYSLISAKTGEISGNQFVAGSQKYTLSDHLAVYELRNGTYYLSSLARVQSSAFTLTGWYDKTDAAGGRLRVIVARES